MSVVSIGALRTRSTSPGSCSNHPQKKFSENSCPKREFFVFRKTPRHSVRAAKNRQRGISRFGRSRRFASVGLAPGFAMTKKSPASAWENEKTPKNCQRAFGQPEKGPNTKAKQSLRAARHCETTASRFAISSKRQDAAPPMLPTSNFQLPRHHSLTTLPDY